MFMYVAFAQETEHQAVVVKNVCSCRGQSKHISDIGDKSSGNK